MSLHSLDLKTMKRKYTYSSTEHSEVVLIFERNDAGLKKLSNFVWTEKWLICLPKRLMCLFKYVVKCEQHFPFFVCRPGLTVPGLARVYCTEPEASSFPRARVPTYTQGPHNNHKSGGAAFHNP
jgi:hypothetical protein